MFLMHRLWALCRVRLIVPNRRFVNDQIAVMAAISNMQWIGQHASFVELPCSSVEWGYPIDRRNYAAI